MTPARALGAGLFLTATAGFTDGIGFIALGGHYTSFMSGNTTRLGNEIAAANWTEVLLPAELIALFFIGSFTGSLVALSSRRWGPSVTLALVAFATVVTVVLVWARLEPSVALLPLALAAGAQNAVLQPIGAARLGATFVTGTLYAAGQDLARAVYGTAPQWRWAQHVMVWAALSGGGLLGALAYGTWRIEALVVPAAIYLATMTWFAIVPPRSEPK